MSSQNELRWELSECFRLLLLLPFLFAWLTDLFWCIRRRTRQCWSVLSCSVLSWLPFHKQTQPAHTTSTLGAPWLKSCIFLLCSCSCSFSFTSCLVSASKCLPARTLLLHIVSGRSSRCSSRGSSKLLSVFSLPFGLLSTAGFPLFTLEQFACVLLVHSFAILTESASA